MATGMNPTWVLSEDQRRKRFKKYRDYGNPDDDDHSSSQSPEQDLMDAKDPASRRRIKSCPSPQSRHRPATPDYASRASRLSGPMFRDGDLSPEALHVPVIKTEQKEEFELSPLRDDPFNMDFGDHNKHLEDHIKMEPDLDSLDNIESLFNTTDQLETFDPKSKISHFDPSLAMFDQSITYSQYRDQGKRDKASSPEANKPVVMIEKPLYLELTQEEILGILKLEMSFENSNQTFPTMSEETMEIWNYVESSCNFQTLKHGFTSGLLTEAIELCLRRNLIFLQENSDFTSLSMDDRKFLYAKNMGNMCHVRGVMQLKAKYNFACNTGSNCFQISYKQQRTGKIKRWNMVDFPFDQIPNFSDSFDSSDGSNSPKNFPWSANPNLPKTNPNHPSRAKFDLLHMAESLRSLELERVSYLILLLVVLFCGQGETMNNNDVVDRMQNQYMVLLYRYLQHKYGPKKVHSILSKIMTFVLNMLTDAY